MLRSRDKHNAYCMFVNKTLFQYPKRYQVSLKS